MVMEDAGRGAQKEFRTDPRGTDGEGLDSADEQWIETRRGYVFFLNGLLVAPLGMVLLPLALRWLLRRTGVLEGPSVFLDPFPLIAQYVLP